MALVWVHVDGVPYSVRHFLGLWAVRSLIGTTLDVDLCSLRSLGIIRILVAIRDPTALEKDNGCMQVIALLQLNGYMFHFRREAVGFKLDPRFRPFFGRTVVMMMALMVLRRRGLMILPRMLHRRQRIWRLMVTLRRILRMLQRCRSCRWL
jgi:hypothetical protein